MEWNYNMWIQHMDTIWYTPQPECNTSNKNNEPIIEIQIRRTTVKATNIERKTIIAYALS